MKDTGERLVYSKEIQTLSQTQHIARYEFAAKLVRGARVLDVACGSGYGAEILLKKGGANSVVGVDIDHQAVKFSSDTYRQRGLSFIVGSAEKLNFDDNAFDVVVSFETIEHLSDHHSYLEEVKRVLVDNGMYIMSTPDKSNYKVYNLGAKNKFHISELSRIEITDLLNTYFNSVKFYGQVPFENRLWTLVSKFKPVNIIVNILGISTLYTIYQKLTFLPGLSSFYNQVSAQVNVPISLLDNKEYVYILAVARNSKKSLEVN